MVPNVDFFIVLTLTLVEKQRTTFRRQKLVAHISGGHNRVDSSDPSLREAFLKLRKICGFTKRICFYVFLSSFYSLETFVLYRLVKTFKTARKKQYSCSTYTGI